MEGMIRRKAHDIQTVHYSVCGSQVSPQKWTTGTIIKLLEVTHAQWLYGCIQTHDKAARMLRTLRKEELQREIDRQLETGSEDLLEQDHT